MISSSSATAVFPGGDFGNFLASGGGIVEYYSTGTIGQTTFTLPSTYVSGANTISITGYNNLTMSPAASKNIILPDTDLHIYDELTISGAGFSQLNVLASTRTVEIDSSLNVVSGTLRYMNGNNTAQNMIVYGNTSVGNGAVFDVNTSGTAANMLTIHGNLTNNGPSI
jgi:predicted ATPase